MGAFLLINRDGLMDEDARLSLAKAKNIFNEIGLPVSADFKLKEHNLFLYSKLSATEPNFILFEEGNLIAATGSLIYKSCGGRAGLELLYRDFSDGKFEIESCLGNYCVIISINDELHVFRDYLGIYPVFYEADYSVLSSSFLAVACFNSGQVILKNELYEYLFNGFWYGLNTFLEGIQLLPYKKLLNITDKTANSFKADYKDLSHSCYAVILNRIYDRFSRYFDELIKSSETSTRIGLSGGYDSRLMLAALLSRNKLPELYVNGPPDSKDVRCAQIIAEGIGAPLDHIPYYKYYKKDSEGMIDNIQQRFFFFDGLGTNGLFDNFSDLEAKLSRPIKDITALHGAGGEIYRESWNLPDRKIRLSDFVNARYAKPEFMDVITLSSKKSYLNHLESIFSEYFDGHKKISRTDIDKLHLIRHKAHQFIIMWNQYFNRFFLPFLEPNFILEARTVPFKYKAGTKLNRDLISSFSTKISEYPSAYGYSFDKNIPPVPSFKAWIIRNLPLGSRSFLKKLRKDKRKWIKPLGYNFLFNEMVGDILKRNDLIISDYIDLSKVKDDILLSRTLSVEILLGYLNCRDKEFNISDAFTK